MSFCTHTDEVKMKDVLIVGDGPAGLSAALLLAKNDLDAAVFGTDDTPMHKALLLNYLGIPELAGSEFQAIAREQVQSFGAELNDVKVSDLAKTDEGFSVTTENGDTIEGRYLVLATTNKNHLDALGVDRSDDGTAAADRNCRTNIGGCYAVGWAARKDKIQAIISAGDGAVAALDILSRQRGEPFHDFDVV